MESRPVKSERHEIGKKKYSLFQTQKLHQRKCHQFLSEAASLTQTAGQPDPMPKPGEFVIFDRLAAHLHLPAIEPKQNEPKPPESARQPLPPWTPATAADQPQASLEQEYETVRYKTPSRDGGGAGMRRVKSYQGEPFITRSIKEILASEKDATVMSAARLVTATRPPEKSDRVRRPSASQILQLARMSSHGTISETPQRSGRTPSRGTPNSTFRGTRFIPKASLVQTLIHAKATPKRRPMRSVQEDSELLRRQKEFKEQGRADSPFMERHHVEPIWLVSRKEGRSRSPRLERRESNSGKVFLPLEMYDPLVTEEQPDELMAKYADSTGKVPGMSRYFDKQAEEWSWEPCEVLRYEKESEHFVIAWTLANGQKKVSRLNLRFELEDGARFEARLAEAQQHRTQAEMIMKYNFVVDTMEDRVQQMQDGVKERIAFLILSYSHCPPLTQDRKPEPPRFAYRNVSALLDMPPQERYNSERACSELYLRRNTVPPGIDLKEIVKNFETRKFSIKTLRALFKELERDFERANHAAVFEATLPFLPPDSPHFQYRTILPKQKFKSYAQRSLLDETPELGVVLECPPEADKGMGRRARFRENLQTMNSALHQGHRDTLRILQKLNITLEGIKDMNLFEEYYRRWVKLDEFRRNNLARSVDVVRELKNSMFDSQYEANHLVELMFLQIEEKNTVKVHGVRDKSPRRLKRMNLQLPPDFCRRILRFQSLMNALYERTLRDCYTASCRRLLQRFQEMSSEIERSVPFLRTNMAEDTVTPALFKQLVLEGTWTRKDPRRPVFKSRLVCIPAESGGGSSTWDGPPHGGIALKPSLEEWALTLSEIVCSARDEIAGIPCIATNEFGNTRASGTIQLFEEFEGEDAFTPALLDELEQEFQLVSKPVRACLKLLNRHAGVLCVQPKHFKRALLKTCQAFQQRAAHSQASYNAAHADILRYLEQQLQSLVAARETVEALLPRTRAGALKERNPDGSLKIPESGDAGYLVVSCFGISSQALRESSLRLLKELEDIVFEYVVRLMEEDNQEIQRKVKQSLERIAKEPRNIEELVELKNYNDNIRTHTNPIIEAITAAMDKMKLLERFQYRLSQEKFARTWISFSRPLDIYMAVGECQERLKGQKAVFEQELKEMRVQVAEQVAKLKDESGEVKKIRLLTDYDDASYRCNLIWERLTLAIDYSLTINRREGLFEKLDTTNYEELFALRAAFEPFLVLWNLARDYFDKKPLWTDGHLADINRDALTREVASALQKLASLLTGPFAAQSAPATVALELQHLLEDFKPYLPIIYDLRNPALRAHHWSQLQKHTKCEQLRSELGVSLNELLQQGVMEYKDIINEVSEFASKEQLLLSIVQRMRDQWKQIKFELRDFRDTHSAVLVGVEPVWELLDQHLVRTMQILQSPYAVNIEGEVAGWKGILVRVQEALEQWTQAQRYWVNLQPVFESKQLRERLPREAQHFDQQNKLWNMYMHQAKSNPNVIDMCYSTKVGEGMAGANEKFKTILKELHDYLDSKRAAFPRFYFLSNEELLAVLAQANDPVSLQLYVHKCFEGIDALHFDQRLFHPPPQPEIQLPRVPYWVVCGMASGKNYQYVEFLQHVYPFDRKQEEAVLARNPEIWLREVDSQMNLALRSQLRDAIALFPDKAEPSSLSPPRAGTRQMLRDVRTARSANSEESMRLSEASDDRDWLCRFPSQITQLAQQIVFTQQVELALKVSGGDPNAMDAQAEVEAAWLAHLSRSITDPATPEQLRHNISQMYILQLHNRDVLAELERHGVAAPQDFEWLAQIKYRYILAQKQEKGKRRLVLEEQRVDRAELRHQRLCLLKKDSLQFELLLASRPYGFEYLGQAGRLILTPLTLRSYRTMCTALTLSLGGAVEGPAGTGKTETVKDFARALGKKIVVFNCSESLEVGTLSKMLKGLTCCGAFACFDEFNRVEPEVLSVVAQHIATIQLAIQAEVTSYASPDDGQQIKLDPSCAIFMTLNPDGAARPLPENLRAFFRPVAMVKADVQIIAEALLASAGFQSAFFLSKKLVNALNFASNELTRRAQYDFGMRTVKAVAQNAVRLLDEAPEPSFSQPYSGDSSRETYSDGLQQGVEAREGAIMCRALRQVNLPRFIPCDALKFQLILEALFPDAQGAEPPQYLMAALEQLAPVLRMKLTAEFTEKIYQLHDTMRARHGLMVVGRPMTGKSAIIHTLSRALSWEPGVPPDESALGASLGTSGLLGVTTPQEAKQQTAREEITPPPQRPPKVNVVRSTTLHSMKTMSLPTPGDVSVVEEAPARGVSTVNRLPNQRVVVRAINPKSLSLGKLFGEYETASNQWVEGVFGRLVKECLEDVQRSTHRQYWIVLDGPVDPQWVENLNTLLDDNKKLCLANGEIIPVPAQMRVVFEVDHLEEASPATISRCGVVFMPSVSLRWRTLLDPWIDSLPPSFRTEAKRSLYLEFVDLIVEPLMVELFPEEHLSEECDDQEREERHLEQKQRTATMHFAVPVLPEWLVQNLLKLYESFLMGKRRKEQILQEEQEERDREERREMFEKMTSKASPRPTSASQQKMAKRYTVKPEAPEPQDPDRALSGKEIASLFNQFILALVWSVGCTLEVNSRPKFNQRLKQILTTEVPKRSSFYSKFNAQHRGYESVTVYFNSAYDARMQNWFPWAEALAPQTQKRGEDHTVISSSILGLIKSKGPSIFVPTVDSTRYSHLILHMMLHSHPVLLAGKSGTAKTATLTQCLVTLASDVLKPDSKKPSNLGIPQLHNSHIDVLKLVLNAASSPAHLQTLISEKLEKKRKGEFGPLPGFYKLVVFLDDLHAPERHRYGAQPPIELIRSWLDYRGWYQQRSSQFSRIEGLKLVGAFTTDIIVNDKQGAVAGGDSSFSDVMDQAPAASSQTQLSLRFARHFNILFLPPLEKISLERIFSTMLDRNLAHRKLDFEFKQTHIWRIVRLTVELFTQASAHFPPTPSRPHYLFNMRDISRIVEGMLQISDTEFRRIGELPEETMPTKGSGADFLSASGDPLKADSASDIDILKEPSGTFKDDLEKQPKDSTRETAIRRLLRFLYRLWLHESTRVLSDRLVSVEEHEQFASIVHSTIADVPYLDYGGVHMHDVLFANFGQKREYIELLGDGNPDGLGGLVVPPVELARRELTKVMEDYAAKNKGNPLDLVLFDYAIIHLARISRVLHKPGGHILLIGTGGTGRRTLTKLAGFINNCEVHEPHRVRDYGRYEWDDDLKTVMRRAGVQHKPTVFYLEDRLLLRSKGPFLEDVNSLLTSGEVARLLSKNEKEDLIQEMRRTRGRKSGNLMEAYTAGITEQLHLVLCVNPAHQLFGSPLRQFPSLLTATTLNWMAELPLSALKDVAEAFFIQVEQEIGQLQKQVLWLKRSGKEFEDSERKLEDMQMLKERRRTVSALSVDMHAAAGDAAEKARRESGRRVGVTLGNFRMALQKVKELHSRLKGEKIREIAKYRAGVEKLDQANLNVGIMKEEQEKLQPELEQKNREVEQTLGLLQEKTQEQQTVKEQVLKEEEVVLAQKEISEKMRDDCQTRLNKALPELHAAIEALKTINTQDFITMRSYNRPHELIQLTLETVCILLGVKPEVVERTVRGKRVKTHEYWDKAKRLLKDYKKLIERLEHFDRDNIPDDRIRKLQSYLNNPSFKPQLIKNASGAAEGLCKWVLAIAAYNVIAKEIAPKREALKVAKERYEEVRGQLAVKQEEMAAVEAKLSALQDTYEAQNFDKNDLLRTLDMCCKKQDRALKLLNGLSSEQSRWSATADALTAQLQHGLGDALLSATYMTYLGPFAQNQRAALKNQWLKLAESAPEGEAPISHSQKFCATKTLSDALQMSAWVLKGLPNELQSKENVSFMHHCVKFPLLVDPQGQAARYIKQADPKLHIVKSPVDYAFLEKALLNGWTVLLEDALPDDDPTLQNLLMQNLQTKAGPARLAEKVSIVVRSEEESKQGQTFQTMPRSVTAESEEWEEEEKGRTVKLNEQELDWNLDFRLYMATSEANPAISSRFFSGMFVLNFSITPGAIEEQLLSRVAWIERQRDQEERLRILEQMTAFRQRKKDIEHEILTQLQRVGGAILQDDALVTSLNFSKEVSEDLEAKLRSAKVVEDKLESSRTELLPVAAEATVFYFLIQDLPSLSPAYRFSHQWFMESFYTRALNNAGDTHRRPQNVTVAAMSQQSANQAEQDKRNAYLQRHLRKVLFEIMSMALYSQHQLSFTLAMALKLRAFQGLLDQELLRFLVSGVAKETQLKMVARPKSRVLTVAMWENLGKLEQTGAQGVQDLRQTVVEKQARWEEFIISGQREASLPEPFDKADPVLQMALAKILRTEDTLHYAKRLITESLGDYFLNDPIQGLKEAAQVSHADTPVLVLLPQSSGDDPFLQISKTAQELNKKVHSMSLGRECSRAALELLESAFRAGRWLVLQNCHLAGQVLDKVLQKFKELKQPGDLPRSQLSYDFRLWLTVKPLQGEVGERVYSQCLKVSNDPPDSVNGVLTKIYAGIKNNKKEVRSFESNKKIHEWRKLFMGLSFVHAITRLRKRYGQLGWSGFSAESYSPLYDFNDDDFQAAKAILYMLLNRHFDLQQANPIEDRASTPKLSSTMRAIRPPTQKLSAPLPALRYITSRCIYGARMWEERDENLLAAIFRHFYSAETLQKSDFYIAGDDLELFKILATPYVYEVMAYLKATMPKTAHAPEVLGLHPNAESIANVKSASSMLHDILLLSNKTQALDPGEPEMSEAHSRATQLLETLELVKKHLPEPLSYLFIKRRLRESGDMTELGGVALGEVARYNQLVRRVRQMVQDAEEAAKGKYSGNLATSSEKIESVEEGLRMYEVPVVWRKISYPTRKPILSWLKGLQKRMDFFERWGVDGKAPQVMELPAFFYPLSLLTRIRQLHARSAGTSYDMVEIRTSVLRVMYPVMQVTARKRKTFTVRSSYKRVVPPLSGRKTLALNYLMGLRREQAFREEEDDDGITSFEQSGGFPSQRNSDKNPTAEDQQQQQQQQLPVVDEGGTPYPKIEPFLFEHSVLVTGVYLEGASWNMETCSLQEARPREVKCEMPVFRLQTYVVREIEPHRTAKTESPEVRKQGPKAKKVDIFSEMEIPLYSTRERAVRDEEALTFDPKVMTVQVKCPGIRDKWLKRGVAFISEYDT